MEKVDCILLAAGRGVRMGAKCPKQFLRLAGKPLMVHALELFERLDEIGRVLVTCLPGYEREYETMLEHYSLSKPHLIAGGTTRQWSVHSALREVTTRRVLVHEAVRPFITGELTRRVLSYEYSAVVPTCPIPFTVSEGTEFMEGELQRSILHNVQLPQAFDTDVLRRAHERFHELGTATEDSLLVFRLGERVRFVAGLEHNIKITTPLDLKLAELIYDEQ